MISLPGRILRNRWVKTFVGALLLMIVVWFFGPLLGIGVLHPLSSPLARIAAILVILVGWLIENLIHELRVRKKDKDLTEGIAATATADPAAAASAEEVALLSDRMKEALHALKKAKLGGRSSRFL